MFVLFVCLFVSGIIDGTGSIGASVQGVLIGLVASGCTATGQSWDAVFNLLVRVFVVCCCCCLFFFFFSSPQYFLFADVFFSFFLFFFLFFFYIVDNNFVFPTDDMLCHVWFMFSTLMMLFLLIFSQSFYLYCLKYIVFFTYMLT